MSNLKLLFLCLLFGCVQTKENPTKDKVNSTLVEPLKTSGIKELKTLCDFNKLFKTLENVQHTKGKHLDELSNSSSHFVSDIFGLEEADLEVKTTSYEYKKDCIIFVHTIKHTDNSVSIKPFLENAQGTNTKGYLTERTLIFSMKNDKEANYIDIPPNWNHIELAEEFYNLLLKQVNSDVILCYRTQKCAYKDLRKSQYHNMSN